MLQNTGALIRIKHAHRLTSRLCICGTVILTGSVLFLGLGRLEKKPLFGASSSSFDTEAAVARLILISVFGPLSCLGADALFLGAGRSEKSPVELNLLGGAGVVEVSSESLSSLLA